MNATFFRGLSWIPCGMAALVALSSCASEEEAARTRSEFCTDWAAAACNEEVVSACQAEDEDACRRSQEAFCDGLLPDDYSDAKADACLEAVENAYEDADLEADELAVVLRLAPPCDRVVVGDREEGESCEASTECDRSAGYDCVRKLGQDRGVCEIPERVEGGRNCEAAQKTCVEGFFCDGSNCIEARPTGASCSDAFECGETGFCSLAGECEERFEVDQPCTDDAQCLSGICQEFEGELLCTDRIRLARAEPPCDQLM